jgi:hypothetical protein
MAKLIISAAHTKENPGTIYGDLREADLTRKILSLTVPHLEKQKIDFISVPLDLPLMNRIAWINQQDVKVSNGDIFVELHINDGGKSGIETWFRDKSDLANISEKLAKSISDDLSKKFNWTNQGAKSEYEHSFGSLMILNSINVPGIAIEILYIDNPEDIAILRNDKKLNEIAEEIAISIGRFLKTHSEPNQSEIDFFEKKIKKSDDDLESDLLLDDNFLNLNTISNNSASSSNSNNFFNNPTTLITNPVSSNNSSSGVLMDRDQRKEMIKSIFRKIFDREPTDAELNTNLNVGISEIELYKKLIDSDEYKKILENHKNFVDVDKRFKDIEKSNLVYKKNEEDTKKMITSLNQLISLKNQYIAQMQNELAKYKVIIKGEYYHPERTNKKDKEKKLVSKKPDMIDKIVKLLKI